MLEEVGARILEPCGHVPLRPATHAHSFQPTCASHPPSPLIVPQRPDMLVAPPVAIVACDGKAGQSPMQAGGGQAGATLTEAM